MARQKRRQLEIVAGNATPQEDKRVFCRFALNRVPVRFKDLKIGDKSFNYNTLEPKMLKVNGLKKLNTILGTTYKTEDELHKHMKEHKTDCALKIFDTKEKIDFPQYILFQYPLGGLLMPKILHLCPTALSLTPNNLATLDVGILQTSIDNSSLVGLNFLVLKG